MVKWAWESNVVGLCHNIIIMPEQLHHHHAATIRCPKCRARVAQRWSLPPQSTPWPSNTIQDLTLPLTTGIELPSHVVLNGKDHKVALASFTYLTYGMWPMPSSTRPASLSCQATSTHPPTSVNEEGEECDDNGDKRPLSPAYRGPTFIKG